MSRRGADRGSDEFEWDYEDRLVSATVDSATTTFAYRGDGLRESRTFNSNTVTFTWDIAAGLPVVIDDEDARYVYGAGLASQVTSTETYYYLPDGLGSTMVTVDSDGDVVNSYTYDVFGETRSESGAQANEFQFAGQQVDGSTGLQYLRARYLDMETGRFISRDPMSSAPGWTGSSYGYGNARPTLLVDPLGLDGGIGLPDPCEVLKFMWTPCEQTEEFVESATEAGETLTEIVRQAGYLDANVTLGLGVAVTFGCQVETDDLTDLHCYLGGGVGTSSVSLNFGPGQTIVDGWACGVSGGGGFPVGVGGQAGRAGIGGDEDGKSGEPFAEVGISNPGGFSTSVTCYYVADLSDLLSSPFPEWW